MHIHAQPVAGAVHVKLEVGTLVDHVLGGAHLVLVQQPQVEQALRQHGHRGVVRVVEARTGLGGCDGGVLAGQHQVVQRALRGGELAIGRESAGDVAGVAVQLAACVNQHQLPIAHRRGIGPVVEYARIGACCDDGAIGGVLRAAFAEGVQQLGIEVVFTHILPGTQHAGRPLHRADMGLGADLAGAAHDVQLMRVLDEAHLVEQGAHIALLRWAQRSVTHAGAHGVEPALHPRRQARVRGEGVPDAAAVFQQAGQLGIQHRRGLRSIHPQRFGRGGGAQAVAVPDFALQILGLAKQRAVPLGREHQHCTRLGKAGQVVEVAVVPVDEVRVAVARAFRRGGDDGDAASTQHRSEAGTALGVDGLRCIHVYILSPTGAAPDMSQRICAHWSSG